MVDAMKPWAKILFAIMTLLIILLGGMVYFLATDVSSAANSSVAADGTAIPSMRVLKNALQYRDASGQWKLVAQLSDIYENYVLQEADARVDETPPPSPSGTPAPTLATTASPTPEPSETPEPSPTEENAPLPTATQKATPKPTTKATATPKPTATVAPTPSPTDNSGGSTGGNPGGNTGGDTGGGSSGGEDGEDIESPPMI